MNEAPQSDDSRPDAHHQGPSAPSPWVLRFAGRVPEAGPVLDLACGEGRHTRLFLARGHPVTAVDRDLSGIADLAGAPGGWGASLISTGPAQVGVEVQVSKSLVPGRPKNHVHAGKPLYHRRAGVWRAPRRKPR